MLTTTLMRGVWTALVTPFNEKNDLDLAAFERILQEQKDAGVAGVIPCGTTGESPCLSLSEKKRLISTTVEYFKGTQVRVVAGTGSNNTADSIELSQWACDQGVDGVLIVTPYYNKPTQQGLDAHFKAIANSVDREVILYNVPGRTGVGLTAETIVRLAEHPRIRTLKEASGNVAFSSEILDCARVRGVSLDVLSGDDANFLPLFAIGAVGVISVASNLIPRPMVAIQKAMEEGRFSDALSLHRFYYPLFRDLFLESNPIPIKFAMAAAGWCREALRLPLLPLSSPHREVLERTLKAAELLPGGCR